MIKTSRVYYSRHEKKPTWQCTCGTAKVRVHGVFECPHCGPPRRITPLEDIEKAMGLPVGGAAPRQHERNRTIF